MATALFDTRDRVHPDPIRTRSPGSHLSFSSNKSLLFEAIRYGHIKTVRELLKEMPNLAQVTDNRGYTPLHYAALYGTPEMVQILRRANAKIDAQDHSGNTPLHYSCAEIAEALIAMNASIESRNLQGSTALHMAAKMGAEDKVSMLLDANADVQSQDKLQNTPLHYAALAGHYRIVKVVLGRGANVDSVNKEGLTPLSLAIARQCSSQLERIVSLLLNANANVNIANRDGDTALHHAAMNQNSNIVKLLIQRGGNVYWANLKGLTVWNLARRPGRHEIKKAISESLPDIIHWHQNYLKECVLCCDQSSLRNFPHSPHLRDHDVCIPCIREYVRTKILDHGEMDINCPDGDCAELLKYDEVKRFCLQSTFTIYDQLLLKRTLESDPSFRYCANKACSAGQIVDNGDQSSFFTCVSCKFKTCFQCRGPAHPPLTCEQHQAFLRAQLAPTDARSLQWMSHHTKRCSKCKVMIEKSDGCDHMTCSRCRAEWCWLCGADYQRIRNAGNTAHVRTCRYYA